MVIAPFMLEQTEDQIRLALKDARRVNRESLHGAIEASKEIREVAGNLFEEIFPSCPVFNAEPISATAEVSFRHFSVRQSSEHQYSVEYLSENQQSSWCIAKFPKCWCTSLYRSALGFDRAFWAHEKEVGQDELRLTVVRALESAPASGHVLVVHAPGRVALVWSDQPIPRLSPPETGFNLRAEQPIFEVAPPAWWPT